MFKNIFVENWEKALDKQMLTYDRVKKRAYICSPLGAKDAESFIRNMHAARAYMYYAMTKMRVTARAPHSYLPLLLCDRIPAERALALDFGIKLLENCDILLVCGTRISDGMLGEINRAVSLGMDIVVFDELLFPEVRKIVTKCGGDKHKVSLDRNNFFMAMSDPISCIEEGRTI